MERKKIRIEKDSLGTVEVPLNSLWGAQTQRALNNFKIGDNLMPLPLIFALTQIKKSAAIINNRLNLISNEKKDLIVNASDQIIEGRHNDQFPLPVWQSGSGTQTNMNVNEVISNIVLQKKNLPLGSYKEIHPNDDVNKSQSTNDVFPSAIHIATVNEIKKRLLPEIELLIKALDKKATQWESITKIGRTHLQDAVPLTLGQEVSGWMNQILNASRRIEKSLEDLLYIPIGGTAVGTGLNAPDNFDVLITEDIANSTGFKFKSTQNKFSQMASHDELVNTMSCLKLLAVSLLKIVNDIRLLSSGPRTGIGELELPDNEPGSSIMPGKVNPTQCEAMAMICTQIIALEVGVTIAGSGGHLQMNVYKPLIAFNILTSVNLLSDACHSCRTKMITGIEPNRVNIKSYVENSLMLVTSLTPRIGYEKACKIAQLAHKKNLTLKEASEKLGFINNKEFDNLININMTQK